MHFTHFLFFICKIIQTDYFSSSCINHQDIENKGHGMLIKKKQVLKVLNRYTLKTRVNYFFKSNVMTN